MPFIETSSVRSIEICLCFDENNIKQAYVTCKSIIDTRKASSHVRLHLVHTGRVSGFFDDLVCQGVVINLIAFSEVDVSLPGNDYVSSAAYLRLYLAELLPQDVGRFIYLDTDVIVRTDLKKLYDIPLAKYPVAAVPDYGLILGSPLWFDGTWRVKYDDNAFTMQDYCRKILGITSKNELSYLNTGIMLIDRAEWYSISQSALAFIKSHRPLYYLDQDALSSVLNGRFLKIKANYNCFSYICYQDGRTLRQRLFGYARKLHAVKRLCRKSPLIIHYCGIDKPWKKTPATPMEAYWWDAVRGSKVYDGFKDILPSKNFQSFEPRML